MRIFSKRSVAAILWLPIFILSQNGFAADENEQARAQEIATSAESVNRPEVSAARFPFSALRIDSLEAFTFSEGRLPESFFANKPSKIKALYDRAISAVNSIGVNRSHPHPRLPLSHEVMVSLDLFEKELSLTSKDFDRILGETAWVYDQLTKEGLTSARFQATADSLGLSWNKLKSILVIHLITKAIVIDLRRSQIPSPVPAIYEKIAEAGPVIADEFYRLMAASQKVDDWSQLVTLMVSKVDGANSPRSTRSHAEILLNRLSTLRDGAKGYENYVAGLDHSWVERLILDITEALDGRGLQENSVHLRWLIEPAAASPTVEGKTELLRNRVDLDERSKYLLWGSMVFAQASLTMSEKTNPKEQALSKGLHSQSLFYFEMYAHHTKAVIDQGILEFIFANPGSSKADLTNHSKEFLDAKRESIEQSVALVHRRNLNVEPELTNILRAYLVVLREQLEPLIKNIRSSALSRPDMNGLDDVTLEAQIKRTRFQWNNARWLATFAFPEVVTAVTASHVTSDPPLFLTVIGLGAAFSAVWDLITYMVYRPFLDPPPVWHLFRLFKEESRPNPAFVNLEMMRKGFKYKAQEMGGTERGRIFLPSRTHLPADVLALPAPQNTSSAKLCITATGKD